MGQKSRRTESCNFPTDGCKFPTKDILGAQNFNFAPKFPKVRNFQPQIYFVFLDENFPTKGKIFPQTKIYWDHCTFLWLSGGHLFFVM